MSVEELARRIKNAKPRQDELSDLVYGKVVKTSPLTIKIENRFEISAPFIIVSKTAGSLTNGDGVLMMRVQQGQKYFVMEKV